MSRRERGRGEINKQEIMRKEMERMRKEEMERMQRGVTFTIGQDGPFDRVARGNVQPFIPEAVRFQLRKKYKKEDRKNANFIQRQTAEALALKNSLKNSNVNPRYLLDEEQQAYVDSEKEKANSLEREARDRFKEEEENLLENYDMTGFDGGKRKKKKYTQRRQKKQRRRSRHRRSTKKYHRK